jgi:hypothetical protein
MEFLIGSRREVKLTTNITNTLVENELTLTRADKRKTIDILTRENYTMHTTFKTLYI